MAQLTYEYGLVKHARSGEFYVVRFETSPDEHGVYHIIEAAGPLTVAEQREIGGPDGIVPNARPLVSTAEYARTYLANQDTDDITADGAWLDGEPCDLW